MLFMDPDPKNDAWDLWQLIDCRGQPVSARPALILKDFLEDFLKDPLNDPLNDSLKDSFMHLLQQFHKDPSLRIPSRLSYIFKTPLRISYIFPNSLRIPSRTFYIVMCVYISMNPLGIPLWESYESPWGCYESLWGSYESLWGSYQSI